MNKNIQRNLEVKKVLGIEFLNLLSEISPLVSPRIDVFKTEDLFYILVDIAGVKPEDVSVTLQKNILCIDGTILNLFIKKNSEIFIQERFYGDFHKEIIIPNECLINELMAKFENGILNIQIPLVSTKREKEETIIILKNGEPNHDEN